MQPFVIILQIILEVCSLGLRAVLQIWLEIGQRIRLWVVFVVVVQAEDQHLLCLEALVLRRQLLLLLWLWFDFGQGTTRLRESLWELCWHLSWVRTWQFLLAIR